MKPKGYWLDKDRSSPRGIWGDFEKEKWYDPERHANPIGKMEYVEILLSIIPSCKFGQKWEEQSDSWE